MFGKTVDFVRFEQNSTYKVVKFFSIDALRENETSYVLPLHSELYKRAKTQKVINIFSIHPFSLKSVYFLNIFQ